MKELDIFSFLSICEDFVESSRELRDAAALCDDDPVKQDMISFITSDFNKTWARSEGIKVLLQKDNFSENREFVLEEMKAVIKENLEMAKKIRNKIGSFGWN